MRQFLYPEEDSILFEQRRFYNRLKSTFILVEGDLGFSFEKFKMADQVTEGWTKFP